MTAAPQLKSQQQPPGPSIPFWLQAAQAIRDPLRYLIENTRYGGIVKLRENRTYQLNDLEYIGHVLQGNHPNYGKGEHYRRAVALLFGNGLPATEGEFWSRQRKLMQPAFLRKHHDMFATAMVEGARTRMEQWRAYARSGERLNFRNELMTLTLGNLLCCVFGNERAEDLEPVGKALLNVHNEINLATVFSPIRLPDFLTAAKRRRLARAFAVVNPFVAKMVEKRKHLGPNENDVASLLLFARDEETGTGIEENQLRDEIVTILVTGHDSVTEGTTWTTYLLGKHPEVYRKVAAEIRSLMATESPGADLAAKLTYTRMTIQEAMRLYPPIWGFMRTALGDDTIGGYRFQAGTRFILSPYVIHRSPALWEDPERFNPERFSPERSAGRHRLAYFPFGTGPRQCLGGSFAMLQIALTLAVILETFDLDVEPGPEIRPVPRVSLTQNRPLWVRARERKT